MNSVRVLKVKSAMSGDRGQCSFPSEMSLSNYLHTQVKKSNFTLLSICRGLCNRCSVCLLASRLAYSDCIAIRI